MKVRSVVKLSAVALASTFVLAACGAKGSTSTAKNSQLTLWNQQKFPLWILQKLMMSLV